MIVDAPKKGYQINIFNMVISLVIKASNF